MSRLIYQPAPGVTVDICRGCGREKCICATLTKLEDATKEVLIEALRDFCSQTAAEGPVYEWLLAEKGLVDPDGEPDRWDRRAP